MWGSSMKEVPLAKAEPISDGGSTSMITYLRRGKSATAGRREWWEHVKETTLQTQRSVKKEGKVFQAPEKRFPCSPWRRPRWGRLFHCSPWRSMVEQISTCSPWRTACWSRWMHPKEALAVWRPCAGAGSWQDLWLHGERSPGWSRFTGRTCDLVGYPRSKSLFLKESSLWEGPLWRSLSKTVSCRRDPMLEQKSMKRKKSSRDVWWTDYNSHSLSPCAAWGEKAEKLGVKWSPGRKEGWREGVLRLGFISHCTTLIWLVVKPLISLGRVCFAHDGNWLNSPCPYLDPRAFDYIFSPLSSWGGEW